MARRSELPPRQLQRRAFSVAEALEAGMTTRMLAHPRFASPFHGVRAYLPAGEGSAGDAPHAYAEQRVAARARAYLPRLRAAEAFSHTTALFLHRVPIRAREELHVTVPRPAGPARGAGIIGHRSSAAFVPRIVDGVLPCVPPLAALMQAAPLLDSRELVVALDHFLTQYRTGRAADAAGTAEVPPNETLGSRLAANPRSGSRRLRYALTLARVGAESRMETLVRLELAALGLDTLELQADIHDATGHWIGRFDLADRELRRIIEYDGEQHRTSREQYARDQQRLDRAWAAGYRVLRLTASDLAPARRQSTREMLCAFLGRSPRSIPEELRRFLG